MADGDDLRSKSAPDVVHRMFRRTVGGPPQPHRGCSYSLFHCQRRITDSR